MPKGYSERNQGGWRHSRESIDKMSDNRKGLTANEKNGRWMDDKVSYPALHNWVRRHFERPDVCDRCGINPGHDTTGRNKLQWANRTGKYLRDRDDWTCLCVRCHHSYDDISKKRWGNHEFFYKNCLACNMEIKTYPCLVERKKYCSRKCMLTHYKKK